jgi:putative membrane protein
LAGTGRRYDSPVPEPLDPRVALANERTLLSWIRLALALVAVGTTAGTVVKISPVGLHLAVAVVPIALGLVAAMLGYNRWRRVDEAVRSGVALPADRELRLVSLAVAIIALIAGVAATIAVFTR